jgi:GalNAc-alpha-(1->4)-GalNAc-alpha-(1->3)-diNAcBac-PP-undecaprenol alpha-1,4-N-acetyl-D-galactosaminyltransferase
MTVKHRITLLTGSLGSGGAERSLVVLADAFARHGHDVTVAVWTSRPDFYVLADNVTRRQIDLGSDESVAWWNIVGNVRRLLKIRNGIAATQPDIVISFLDGTNEFFLLSSVFAPYLKLISCQNDMRRHAHYNLRWRVLRWLLYPLADCVVFLDRKQGEWAGKAYPHWRSFGIPNPIPDVTLDLDKPSDPPYASPFKKTIFAMGRLVPQKGFDLLLQSFSHIHARFPDWGVVILGEGPDRAALESQRDAVGLHDKIALPGRVMNPFPVLASGDIFAFSSRYEGQGLALAEAMACGLPAVSYDCPSGPAFIIDDNVNGILVPEQDVAGFANALATLMGDDALRAQYGTDATKVRDTFAPDRIVAEWHDLFEKLS